MSLEYWIKRQVDPVAAKIGRALLEGYGDVPWPQEIETASGLDKEWSRQADILTKHFAKKLDMTEEEYRASLPIFAPQSETYKNRFDIPVIVETRFPLTQLCDLIGLNNLIDVALIGDWSDDPGQYKTPSLPYVAWMQDGTKNLGKSVNKVRKGLAQDERGATALDGIALMVAHKDILKKHLFDLPGSQVGSADAPYLDFWHGRPVLDYCWLVDSYRHYGSVSCGRI